MLSLVEEDLERRSRQSRTNKRGRAKKEKPPKEKRPIGRPGKIREPKEKRPPGRPKQWAEENIADRHEYKPKDPDYVKKYKVNVLKPKLQARKV